MLTIILYVLSKTIEIFSILFVHSFGSFYAKCNLKAQPGPQKSYPHKQGLTNVYQIIIFEVTIF